MYQIVFYTDIKGISEVEIYLQTLSKKRYQNKDAKIKFTKIVSYIDLLAEKGLALGEPYIKYLRENIWELRPLRDRILFACLENNKFILLHYFMKQTQKTPLREIEKAKRYLKDYIIRGDKNG